MMLAVLFAVYALGNGLIEMYHAINRQTLHFKSVSGPIANPLMGWAPWATLTENTQPHTLVYADLTWRDFEPQRGVYDFDSFEKKQQFARWRAEHQRVVFRFLCDTPGKADHIDIPDWLFAEIQGKGDRYSNEYGKGFSPDYANPLFLQFHKEAIKALGNRYGKDGFFAYIELGSLGHWGEWHVDFSTGIRRLPVKEIRDQYVLHYIEAFPNTLLLMRRPFEVAKELNLGLFNDMTGDPQSTQEWLNWIAYGGTYDQTEETGALVSIPNGWMKAPIGGEQTSAVSSDVLYGRNLEQTLQLLQDSHTTFIGPNIPYETSNSERVQEGIDRALESMGYHITIRQVQMPKKIYFEKKLELTITFGNDGAAPMYYNWPAELSLIDANGEIRITYRLEMDVRKILPGTGSPMALALPLDGLEKGTYTLGFAILDPATNQPAVKLAMENPRKDLIQEIGVFEMSQFPP